MFSSLISCKKEIIPYEGNSGGNKNGIMETACKGDIKPVRDPQRELKSTYLLFTDNFYQDPFASPAVKLTIEYLFPRPKIQLPVGYSYHNLTAHNLP
ncbi:unnamed protein product, partial [marine sediment metagenome]